MIEEIKWCEANENLIARPVHIKEIYAGGKKPGQLYRIVDIQGKMVCTHIGTFELACLIATAINTYSDKVPFPVVDDVSFTQFREWFGSGLVWAPNKGAKYLRFESPEEVKGENGTYVPLDEKLFYSSLVPVGDERQGLLREHDIELLRKLVCMTDEHLYFEALERLFPHALNQQTPGKIEFTLSEDIEEGGEAMAKVEHVPIGVDPDDIRPISITEIMQGEWDSETEFYLRKDMDDLGPVINKTKELVQLIVPDGELDNATFDIESIQYAIDYVIHLRGDGDEESTDEPHGLYDLLKLILPRDKYNPKQSDATPEELIQLAIKEVEGSNQQKIKRKVTELLDTLLQVKNRVMPFHMQLDTAIDIAQALLKPRVEMGMMIYRDRVDIVCPCGEGLGSPGLNEKTNTFIADHIFHTNGNIRKQFCGSAKTGIPQPHFEIVRIIDSKLVSNECMDPMKQIKPICNTGNGFSYFSMDLKEQISKLSTDLTIQERDAALEKLNKAESDELEAMKGRDHAEGLLDQFASKILNEDINWSDHHAKWEEAYDSLDNKNRFSIDQGVYDSLQNELNLLQQTVDLFTNHLLGEYLDNSEPIEKRRKLYINALKKLKEITERKHPSPLNSDVREILIQTKDLLSHLLICNGISRDFNFATNSRRTDTAIKQLEILLSIPTNSSSGSDPNPLHTKLELDFYSQDTFHINASYAAATAYCDLLAPYINHSCPQHKEKVDNLLSFLSHASIPSFVVHHLDEQITVYEIGHDEQDRLYCCTDEAAEAKFCLEDLVITEKKKVRAWVSIMPRSEYVQKRENLENANGRKAL